MKARGTSEEADLRRRLAEAEATIEALLSGQIDAVVDAKSSTPLLLSKAQQSLRTSEERYRGIVETADEGICTIDASGRITFVNRRLAEMIGRTPEQLLEMTAAQLVFDDGEPVEDHRSRLDRSRPGVSDEADVRLQRSDGAELWVSLKRQPLLAADGSYAGTLAMMTDRTVERRGEEALRASEEKYRTIFEASRDGLMRIDPAVIVFVNQRFADMIGYDASELIGRSTFDFMTPAARAIGEASLARRAQGETGAVDNTFRHRDGSEVAVNIAGSAVFDASKRHVGTMVFIRDVTETKKLQSQLMVSDRMASVGTLAAGVAHEINNPLAAVIANLDFIAESLADALASGEDGGGRAAWLQEHVQAPLEDAQEAAQRVRFIVRDLKLFSRSPSDEAMGPVDVRAIIESSLRIGSNEIRHRARLIKRYAAVPCVEANEARLGQVFLNLIVNAAQAMPEGRVDDNQIVVETRLDGGRVIVEVSDTGAGIPPEVIPRIFDAFFTTKPVGVGTGLGLAICHRIVTDMGGALTVTSEVGKGSVFRVSLLVSAGKEADVAVRSRAPDLGRRGRVLLVDDEELVVRSVERSLARDHDVTTTSSARNALVLLAGGERFDLVLCDLMMPDMTGMDLHRELELVAPDQAERMLFLTGGPFTPAARQFLSDTSKEHLEKPFDAANLRGIVQRYLR